MQNKVVFLDRDGVINEEVNYLFKSKDFKFINGVFRACKYFQDKGFKIIIVTNQSGIAKGLYDIKDFKILNEWMLNQFDEKSITILDVLFCPHNPDENCLCRKPKPGLFLKALEKYNIDMKSSWMIGDKDSDIKAANLAGIFNTILVKTGHEINEFNSEAKFIIKSINESVEIIK